MKKRVSFLLVLILVLTMLCGCGQEEQNDGMQLYYMNIEGTKIIPIFHEFSSEDVMECVNEILSCLQSEPEDTSVKQIIPDYIVVNNCSYNGYMVSIDFGDSYFDLGAIDEVLMRAAIVQSILQIEGVTGISFTVNMKPIMDASGSYVGVMNKESFVENPGKQINSSAKTTLTLYFASSDGTYLVKETRTVHYSSNISMDKLVLEQLMEGPKKSGLQGTIPTGTSIITISTVDGVCYVNLDSGFQNQNNEITEQVVLYSIVNSLTELSDVDKVQLSINGSSSGKCRYDYDLSVMYEMKENLLQAQESIVIEDTEVTKEK